PVPRPPANRDSSHRRPASAPRSAAKGPERSLAVTVVHPGNDRLGYLDAIAVAGHRVWAVGGTNFKPTLLYSIDRGRSFTRWDTPENVPGLRDLHIDGDTVWVVGDRGAIANTSDGGKTWNRIQRPGALCLYSIRQDSKSRFWILGDNGTI